jgi:hypothetical protein
MRAVALASVVFTWIAVLEAGHGICVAALPNPIPGSDPRSIQMAHEVAFGRCSRGLAAAAVLGLVVTATGCGGSADSSSGNPQKSIAPAAKAPAAPVANANVTEVETASPAQTGGGTVVGVIRITGDIPELPPLVRQGDPTIKEPLCAAHEVPDESLMVDRAAENGVANVFVYLAKAPPGSRAAAPAEPVEFDQQNCRFLRRALAVQTGQTVLVKSGDSFAHNVNNDPVRNSKVNVVVQPNDRDGVKLVYDRAEPTPVRVRCDIHPWMVAWHLVLDHPFVAVTDAQGKFTIENLPAGKHQFRVWHERAGLLERSYEVEVTPGGAAEVSLEYPVEKFSQPQ